MLYETCEFCEGKGHFTVPNPEDGGATAIEEQCMCRDGYTPVNTGRLMQHYKYLNHVIQSMPTCDEAGCDPTENFHDEACIAGGILADLLSFLDRIAVRDYVCKHDPTTMKGKPIGMYHCPECGDMVIAGMEHL